jgi:hypothetical protein
MTAASRDLRNSACGGVGVWSSISAGPHDLSAAPWAPPVLNCAGAKRAPAKPASAAAPTTSGNGIFRKAMATKLATAIAHSSGTLRGCRSVRLPMRHTACSTIAATAGLIP